MQKKQLRLAIILGLLSAIGPFAIDMYLPALPLIGQSLHAGTATVQLSLTVFFVAVGGGQLVYGPLSDMFGRKPPLYCGLALFAAGSLGCALATSAPLFIAFRFLQGLGACGGMVIPRAIVRDQYSGIEATKLQSMLMLVFGISPLLAPLTGSFIIQALSWRAVFWTVLGAALVGFGILTTLAESRPAQKRAASSLAGSFHAYRMLLGDRHFVGVALVGTCGMAAFFLYLANSPFIMIQHYHLSPRQYSLAFSLNASAFFIAAQLNGYLAARIGLRSLVRRASTVFAVLMLVLLCLFAAGVDHLWLLIGLLFLGFGCLGMTVPTASILALEDHGAIAGTASSFIGTMQFSVGSAMMALSSVVASVGPLPMVIGIASCAALATTFARLSVPARLPAPARPH